MAQVEPLEIVDSLEETPAVGFFVLSYCLTSFSGWIVGLLTGWAIWH